MRVTLAHICGRAIPLETWYDDAESLTHRFKMLAAIREHFVYGNKKCSKKWLERVAELFDE